MLSKEQTLKVDREHIWHPFTQMKDYEKIDPTVMIRGEGIYLYDTDGNRYIDTISSWWTNLLGHCNPSISQALSQQALQLEHVNFSGFTHPFAAEVVHKLSELLPASLTRFFFSDDGSTAVEIALKIAFQYWKNLGNKNKNKFVMLDNSYHGDTVGAMSVGGAEGYHKVFKPLMFHSFRATVPDCSLCPHRKSDFTFDARQTGCSLQCFESMEKTFEDHHEEIAAVIVEPLLQGAGGMKVYPPLYLEKLRKLCDRFDVLLIFDEVATGFGRTGTLFALEQTSITPDIICLSKGLTAGYLPLSLTVCTERIYQAFYDDYFSHKTFFHGHSYTANPLACSVAIAGMQELQSKNLPASAASVLDHFHNRLKTWQEYDFIEDIRYIGFVGAVDLTQSRKKHIPFESKKRIGYQIYHESLRNGLVLRPLGDTIYWFLPLIVTQEEIDEILDKSLKVIQTVIKENT